MNYSKAHGKTYYLLWAIGSLLYGSLVFFVSLFVLIEYHQTGYIEANIKNTFHFIGPMAFYFWGFMLVMGLASLRISYVCFRNVRAIWEL